MSKDELRKQILKSGKVCQSSWSVSAKMYSNGSRSPIKSKSQEIVEIGIDDLMGLIEQNRHKELMAIKSEVPEKKTGHAIGTDSASRFVAEFEQAKRDGYNQARKEFIQIIDTHLERNHK